jgi:hypothetical protein
MTRKLKLVPVLFFVVLLSAFTNPGDQTTPTGDDGVFERKFWGKDVHSGPCTNGTYLRTTKTYRFWIKVDEETTPQACNG